MTTPGNLHAALPALPTDLGSHRVSPPNTAERGRSLGAITTSIVQSHVDAFGKGPTFARTDLRDGEYALCILRDSYTCAEKTLVAAGRTDLVRQGREATYTFIESDLRAIVETALARPVIGVAATVTPEVGLVTLLFLLGPGHRPPDPPPR